MVIRPPWFKTELPHKKYLILLHVHMQCMPKKKCIFGKINYVKLKLKLCLIFINKWLILIAAMPFFLSRSDSRLKELFSKSSLMVIREEMQKNLPSELYGVKM